MRLCWHRFCWSMHDPFLAHSSNKSASMCSDNRIESERARDSGSPRPRIVTVDETPTVQLSVHRRPQVANSSFVTLAPTSGSTLLSRYLLEDIIGQAGTSIVFRAKDLLRDQAVA